MNDFGRTVLGGLFGLVLGYVVICLLDARFDIGMLKADFYPVTWEYVLRVLLMLTGLWLGIKSFKRG